MLPRKPNKEKSKTQQNKEFQANKKAFKLAQQQQLFEASQLAEQSQRTARLIEQGILPPSAANNIPPSTQAPSSPSKSKKARTTKRRRKNASKPPATASSASIDTPRPSHKSKGVRPRLKDRKLLPPGQLPFDNSYYESWQNKRYKGVEYAPICVTPNHRSSPRPFFSNFNHESLDWLPDYEGQHLLKNFEFVPHNGVLWKLKIEVVYWRDSHGYLRGRAIGGWEYGRIILYYNQYKKRWLDAPLSLRLDIISYLCHGFNRKSLDGFPVYDYRLNLILSGRRRCLLKQDHCHHPQLNPNAHNLKDAKASMASLVIPMSDQEHCLLTIKESGSAFPSWLPHFNLDQNIRFSDDFLCNGGSPVPSANKEFQPFNIALFELAQKLIPDELDYRLKYESIFSEDDIIHQPSFISGSG